MQRIVTILDTALTVNYNDRPISTQKDLDTYKFQFDDSWLGYVKTAVFYTDPAMVKHLLIPEGGVVTIPWEILTGKPQVLYIGVFGTMDTKIKPTTFGAVRLREGSYIDGTAPLPPTPDVYQQIIGAWEGAKAEEEVRVVNENSRRNNFDALVIEYNALKAELEQQITDGTASVDALQVLETEYANKALALETTYAPRLGSVESQLADKANLADARLKATKLELEDMSANTLGAIAGTGTFNLLSIPQDDSVTIGKVSAELKGAVNSLFVDNSEKTIIALPTGEFWTAGAGHLYIPDKAVVANTLIKTIQVIAQSTGTLKIKFMSKSGSTFTLLNEVVVEMAVGTNSYPINLSFEADVYVGFYSATTNIGYNGNYPVEYGGFYNYIGDGTGTFTAPYDGGVLTFGISVTGVDNSLAIKSLEAQILALAPVEEPTINELVVDINGTGNYTQIIYAFIFCNEHATAMNRYHILLKKGTYNETNLMMPNYTTLEGEDMDKCIIRSNGTVAPYAELPVSSKHGIWCTGNASIKNITMDCNSVKYCIHSDADVGAFVANFENLKLINDQPCIGMGLFAGQYINIKDVECKYTGDGSWAYGTFMHNQNDQASEGGLRMENVKNTNCGTLELMNIGVVGALTRADVINCTSNLIEGGIWSADMYDYQLNKLRVVGDINFIDTDTAVLPKNDYHAEGYYDTYVWNNSGVTIPKGYGVTLDYLNSDNKVKAVKLANARVDGIALKEILNGESGWVCMPRKVAYGFTNGITYAKGTFYKCVNGLLTVTTEELATAICLEDVIGGVIKNYVKVKLL